MIRIVLIIVLSITFSVKSQNYQSRIVEEETVDFDLYIGLFHIGEATIGYKQNLLNGQREMFSVANSTGLVDFLYSFNFEYTANMDKESGLPLVATQILDDGIYKSVNSVEFDHKTRSDSCIIYSDSTGVSIIPKNSFDLLSGIYYLKSECIKPDLMNGDTISANSYFAEEIWKLQLVYQGEETIKTYIGKKICNKFYLIPVKGHFFQRDDDVAFWFTKDDENALIKIQMDFVVSSIKCKVKSYKNTLSSHESIFTNLK